MCGFIITNRKISDLDHINYYIQSRGPDATNTITRDGITFIHNLLSMTGEFTLQPFESDDVVCMYNGEVYNYAEFGDYPSDGYCMIPLYREYGTDFVQKLDGEFCLILFDFKNKIIVLSTDVFGTKPLWMAVNGNDFGIASYESALTRLGFVNIRQVEPNCTTVYDIKWKAITKTPVFEFDLEQRKRTFDDWTIAFKEAIKKRWITSSQRAFIGLSSGYDSGAIHCELNQQKVDYHAYSTVGSERVETLKKRHALIQSPSKGFIYSGTEEDYKIAHKYIKDRVEDFKYKIYSSSSDYNEFGLSVHVDSGSNGLSKICSMAKDDNRRIYISGQGADEIFSDYGFNGKKKFHHSNFGGLFPDDLKEIFPWASFYGSSQRSFLMKEEYVAGAYGIEARYPYLDKFVVQEFLWLHPKLKNSKYKSVLHNYLKEHNYPFNEGEKIGFKLVTSVLSKRTRLKQMLRRILAEHWCKLIKKL